MRGGRSDFIPGVRLIGSTLSGTNISQAIRRRRVARNKIVLKRLITMNINIKEPYYVEKEFLILKITDTYVIWSSYEEH